MKTNKFKVFSLIGLMGLISTLMVINRVATVNNKINILERTNFNFPEVVDEYSGKADLSTIPKTSTDISMISEQRKTIKLEEFETDRFLTPEIDWSKGFNHWFSTHSYFDYFLYASCALMVVFWLNFPNPFYYGRNFPSVFLHCAHCGVVRPFALHQESCRRRKRNLREKIIDKLKPSWSSDGYPITRAIINAVWDISTFPFEVFFSLVIGVLGTAFYIPASLFVLIKEGKDEASEFIEALMKYLWLILTNPGRRMGRLLTTGTTDN